MSLFFKLKKKYQQLKFCDFDGQPLKEGDHVMSLRYELGECRIIRTEIGFAYESIKTGEKVSYAKMIDAGTGYQKVRKLG
jgi:hemerythrin-like domain-containing protein